MIRAASWSVGFVALTLVLLLSLGWTEANGFVSMDVTDLWAKSIVQIEGPAQFKATDAFYPPVPYALSLLGQALLTGTQVPVPFVLSALVGAGLLVLWFLNLRDTGRFSGFTSAILVLLLALNPFFLRALADGPEMMFCILGTWLFARGIVNLRLTGNAPDMMKVAVGLLVVALSDSFGLMLCLGAMPFMIVAARPSMIAASSTGYLVAMFYPVAAAVGSLMFVSLIFDSRLVPLLSETVVPLTSSQHMIVLLGLCPAALVAILRNILMPRLFMPLLAAVGAVLGGYTLNTFFHVEGDPAMAIAPMLGVLVAAIRFWPNLSLREPIAIALLSFSLVSSVLVTRYVAHDETRNWARAMVGIENAASRPDREVISFLRDKSEIMVDVEKNPEIVIGFGSVDQLVIAGQPSYDWALEGGVPRTRYIVVPRQAEGQATADRILRRFPQLKQSKLPGYGEVFENSQWRVFERSNEWN
ncbi:MAG TPA: hypothetical protein DC031_18050 [Sulfitobacter sp.]|uniref:hypothetical protein n=1 Tax=Sulfitobacter dubius TaxID=218673 RepID=UPI000E8DB00F|nr:hypothetical protein [Sulfitobacter sp.]